MAEHFVLTGGRQSLRRAPVIYWGSQNYVALVFGATLTSPLPSWCLNDNHSHVVIFVFVLLCLFLSSNALLSSFQPAWQTPSSLAHCSSTSKTPGTRPDWVTWTFCESNTPGSIEHRGKKYAPCRWITSQLCLCDLSELPSISGPQFLLCETVKIGYNTTYFIRLLWRLNVLAPCRMVPGIY